MRWSCSLVIRLASVGLLILSTPLVTLAAVQPWDACLRQHASELDLHPDVLRALVMTESQNHPLAIGWTDRFGKRHSLFPTSHSHAHQVLMHLHESRRNYDVGVAQVNITNVTRLARPLNFQPVDLLQPCTNLSVAKYILRENLERHGHTWQSLAGYNGSVGSTHYIEAVYRNYCRQEQTHPCTPGRLHRTPSPHDPLPTVRIQYAPVTQANAPIAIEPKRIESIPTTTAAAEPTLTRPPANTAMAAEILAPAVPATLSVLAFCLRIFLPFCLLIVLVVLICYGLRIMLWAIGLVRESVGTLLLGRRPGFRGFCRPPALSARDRPISSMASRQPSSLAA